MPVSKPFSSAVTPFLASLTLMLGSNACGGGSGNDPFVLSGTTMFGDMNPFDEDPTSAWPTTGFEVEPTEGCPVESTGDLADVCVYGPDGEERKSWTCQGQTQYQWNYEGTGGPGLEMNFEQPLYGNNEPQNFAQVMACCSEDYFEGCENAPSNYFPHVQACLKDCAFQLCRKFVVDFKAEMDATFPGPSEEAVKLFQFLDQNTTTCQKEILKRTDCNEIPIASSGYCNSGSSFAGRWDFDKSEFPSYEDHVFDGLCEVNDVFPIPVYPCNGVQHNNTNPLPEPPPPETDDPVPFLVEPTTGSLRAMIDENPIYATADITSITFWKQLYCDNIAPCTFRLEEMDIEIDEIDLGPLSLVDVKGTLFTTANGTHSGNGATLPTSAIQIYVTGAVESTSYPLLDGLPFAWIAHNNSPASLTITESPTDPMPLFSLASSLSLGVSFDPDQPSDFFFEVDPGEYFAR